MPSSSSRCTGRSLIFRCPTRLIPPGELLEEFVTSCVTPASEDPSPLPESGSNQDWKAQTPGPRLPHQRSGQKQKKDTSLRRRQAFDAARLYSNLPVLHRPETHPPAYKAGSKDRTTQGLPSLTYALHSVAFSSWSIQA